MQESQSGSMKEISCFFKAWFANPMRIGAFTPSSKYLINAICNQVNVNEKGFIIELGAGTGCVTKKLVKMGLADRLIVLEIDPEMSAYLRKRFPMVRVINGDASQLKSLLPQDAINNVSQVVSGLPMMNLPSDVRQRILDSSFDLMPKGSQFIQYSYVPFKPPYTTGLECKRLDYVFRNLPPAWIWSFKRGN